MKFFYFFKFSLFYQRNHQRHPVIKHQNEIRDPVRSGKLNPAETFVGTRRHGLDLAALVDKGGKHEERDDEKSYDKSSNEPSGKGSKEPVVDGTIVAKSSRPSVLDKLKVPAVHGTPGKPHKIEKEVR